MAMSNRNNLMMIPGGYRSSMFYPNNNDVAPGALVVQRSDFPKDFIFGAATSAYQVEGAWNVSGKSRSNWDVFTMKEPGRIDDGSNGCTAIDQYNLFREDIGLMKKVGLDSYRFSIAWSRILPGGGISGGINKNGIQYYHDLIDALLRAGIEPCVTLFHWDVPEILEQEYQGFLSRRIVQDFLEYVDLCFWNFGDRVKRWITLNEPWSYTVQGYVYGIFPPNRGATGRQSSNIVDLIDFPVHRSKSQARIPTNEGDPGTEPYIVAHNLILAHAYAVDLYRNKYQGIQGGQIGMTNVAAYFVPRTPDNPSDVLAASRALQFMLGWFVQPMITGEYPPFMVDIVKDRLPSFNDDDKKVVKGSYDFLGINYYTTYYVFNLLLDGDYSNYLTDLRVRYSYDRHGIPIGQKAGSNWLYIVPWGIRDLLIYIKETYNDPIIYITENGVDEKNDRTKNVGDCLPDVIRVNYHNDHLANIRAAMEKAMVRVKGYFLWSLFDNFEWSEGYTVRFGIFMIDFENGHLTRVPKQSALWWMKFLDKKQSKKPAQEIEEDDQGSLKRIRSN